ncbi:hypothetical protein [Microscilla marina]|uniref:Uncharacterized protein n=1 Tax=Microscilla marina ATCC 23134 TaxID=313606 RepID=A1ZYW3_MICM2|nr:hypothetical protein [Microscilla marina]EAY23803.1 hypothetical protein M23134_08478 [Microscilla marina ATCC 23134]EAY23807.1 hypothetical protein M23134_08474 [Microscilla marina ATCC 23134]EAY24399.1 hypothetical protein M23134_01739 [Microscilla marina ATCC 23134]
MHDKNKERRPAKTTGAAKNTTYNLQKKIKLPRAFGKVSAQMNAGGTTK